MSKFESILKKIEQARVEGGKGRRGSRKFVKCKKKKKLRLANDFPNPLHSSFNACVLFKR